MTRFAKGQNAKAVSDRSGLTFPYREMITEPGTGLRVHWSESDGIYNIVQHPQNFIKRVFDDSPPVQFARPSPWYVVEYLVDEVNLSAADYIWYDEVFGTEEAIWLVNTSVVNH